MTYTDKYVVSDILVWLDNRFHEISQISNLHLNSGSRIRFANSQFWVGNDFIKWNPWHVMAIFLVFIMVCLYYKSDFKKWSGENAGKKK